MAKRVKWLWPVAAFAATALYLRSTSRRARVCPQPYPKPRKVGVPEYTGDPCPVWPLDTPRKETVSYRDVSGEYHGNMARRMGACRDGCNRHHAGVDLYANAGDPVLAAEAGRVVNTQSFLAGSHAILVEGPSGVILYGEVTKNSWREFGANKGTRVAKGQPIARVARLPSGSHMLHMEGYSVGTRKNERWRKVTPANLRDLSSFLLRAKAAEAAVA